MINILAKECDFETLRLQMQISVSFSRLEGIQNEAKAVNISSIIVCLSTKTRSHWWKRGFHDVTVVLIYWDIPDCSSYICPDESFK